MDSNRVKRLVSDERDGVAQYGKDPGLDISLARMLFVANAPRAVFRCTRLRGRDSTWSNSNIAVVVQLFILLLLATSSTNVAAISSNFCYHYHGTDRWRNASSCGLSADGFAAPQSRRYHQWLPSSIDGKNGAYHPQGRRGTEIRHRKGSYQRAANEYQ